jgi:MFS family permease
VTSRLRGIAVDTTALRESRDFRLLEIGGIATGIGTQIGLVALPYQVFVQTRSPFLTGLIGIVELGPLVAASLLGGAVADRMDRRRLLLLVQIALALVAGALAALAATGSPPLWSLYVLAGLGAGASSVERVARTAIVPTLVEPEHLRSALSFNFGMYQVTMIVGPALGGLVISIFGLSTAYAIDGVTCGGMALAALMMRPQPPQGVEGHEPVLRSIAEGLRFVRRENGLLGSFAIDLLAMTFGMPRALFPVLSLTVYHAGAVGTGALYASVAVGATVAALTTGWLEHARWLGRIVIGAVLVWGAAVAAAGLFTHIVLAALLFGVAGAADSVSAVCRSTISQTLTPDALRGRMSSVFLLVVAGGPRLGDVESGAVASLVSPRFSVVSGGVACVAGVGLVALAFPGLAAYDGDAVRVRSPAQA